MWGLPRRYSLLKSHYNTKNELKSCTAGSSLGRQVDILVKGSHSRNGSSCSSRKTSGMQWQKADEPGIQLDTFSISLRITCPCLLCSGGLEWTAQCEQGGAWDVWWRLRHSYRESLRHTEDYGHTSMICTQSNEKNQLIHSWRRNKAALTNLLWSLLFTSLLARKGENIRTRRQL